jgi:hypothetical protein
LASLISDFLVKNSRIGSVRTSDPAITQGALIREFEVAHPASTIYALAAAAGVGAINAPMIHRNGRKNPIQNSQ